jgi:hypothetical protein
MFTTPGAHAPDTAASPPIAIAGAAAALAAGRALQAGDFLVGLRLGQVG